MFELKMQQNCLKNERIKPNFLGVIILFYLWNNQFDVLFYWIFWIEYLLVYYIDFAILGENSHLQSKLSDYFPQTNFFLTPVDISPYWMNKSLGNIQLGLFLGTLSITNNALRSLPWLVCCSVPCVLFRSLSVM